MLSPILFVGGLVKVYLSSMSTLAYRELRGVEHRVPAPWPSAPLAPAHSAWH